jgi:hypothetical protein
MFEIQFRIDGHRVEPGQIANEVERAILAQISDSIKKQVGSVRCPDHGKPAAIVATGHTLSDLKLEVSGCCSKLIEMVQQRLR